MKAPRILLVAACLALPLVATAQFETQLQRLDREANARQWARAREDVERQIDAFNAEITAARAKFWATYPDKPGAKEAAKKFFDLLRDKDEFYVTSALSNRMSTGGDPGDSLDDGIRSTARPEFDDFIEAARPGVPMLGGDMMAMMRATWAATSRHPDEYRTYRLERDFWEFDQVHRIPAIWDTPERYPIYLYVRYYRLSYEDAEASVAAMIKLLGKDVVTAAARKVMDAPKSDKGNMIVTATPPVKIGPGGSEVEDTKMPEPAHPIGAYSSPITVFGKLISRDDDRRYLLYLLTSEQRLDSTKLDRANQWPRSAVAYTRLAAAFGEKDLLAAVRKVRTAPKAYSSNTVLDPAAIGSRRTEPFHALEDILARKDPRGYVRAALAFKRSLDSAAAIDAAYASVVASREEAYLNAARRLAKAGPNVASSYEIQTMESLLNAGPEVEKAPEEMVDFPEYVMWKKYPVGSRVTYHERKWMASRPRPGRYVSDDPTRILAYPPEAIVSYQLKAIDDQKAELWFTQAAGGVYGDMHPARDSELSIPAKYQKAVADRNARQGIPSPNAPTPTSTLAWNPKRTADPIESGDEIVEVQGHRIATHWESAKYTADDAGHEQGVTLTVKVWTSDAVPRGLVRRTEDKVAQHIPGQLVPARYIVETYLESFEGFTPPAASGSGPVMTAYTPPSAGGGNGAAPVVAPVPSAPAANIPRQSPQSLPTPTPQVVAKPPTPRPAPVPARPQPAVDTSRMPPEVARQMELSQKYTAAATRATRARSNILQWQQAHAATGGEVPPDVAAARDRIQAKLQAAVIAMSSQNSAQLTPALQALDDASGVIEEFLAR